MKGRKKTRGRAKLKKSAPIIIVFLSRAGIKPKKRK